MEGFKILTEGTYSIMSDGWILVQFLSILGLIVSLIVGILSLCEEFFKVAFGSAICFIISCSLIMAEDKCQTVKPEYKVTPIISDYFIDISKYEITNQEGEIFTIREK